MPLKSCKPRIRIGDRVCFMDSTIRTAGVVIEELGDDYVRVRWNDFSAPTTHRTDSLDYQGASLTRTAALAAL